MTYDYAALSDLQDRVLGGAKIREDHVWSFVKQTTARLCSPNDALARRFRVLLQANAILDALFLAASVQTPPARLHALRRTDRGWACSVSATLDGASRKSTVLHQDVEGAVFLALLKLFQPPRTCRTTTISQVSE